MVDCIGEQYELQGEVTTVVGKAIAQARNTERLAWGTAAKHIAHRRVRDQFPEVTIHRHVWIVVLEHGNGEGLDLAEAYCFPPKRVERDGRSLNAGADG
jgi:hypothetical protein